MLSSTLSLLQLIVVSAASHNLFFGVNFFSYKNVSSIAKFSCGDAKEDIEFIKMCSQSNIFSAVYHPDSSSPIVEILENTDWPIGVWLDTRCVSEKIIKKIINEASEKHLFGKLHRWLVIGDDFNAALKYLNEDAMSLLNDIVIGVANENGSYNLYDIYNPDKLRGGKINITKFGNWKVDTGLNVVLTQDSYSRRSNLHGIHLKTSGLAYCEPNVTPYDCLTDIKYFNRDKFTKFGLTIFLTLGEMFNFQLNITIENDWLTVEPNGTLSGMMPSLGKKEVDFGSSPASVRWAKRGYGQFVMQMWPAGFFFIFRDSTKNIKLTELLSPLSYDVWCSMGALTGFITILLMFILWFENGGTWYSQWGWGILVTIGAVAQQGLLTIPNRASGRLILLSLMIFMFLIINHYSAKVVIARITIPPDRMNDSLWSLSQVKGMRFATFRTTTIEEVLKSSKNWEAKTFFRQVWSRIPSDMKILKPEIGLEKVRQGLFAYHGFASNLYPYISNHFPEEIMCELNEVHVINPHVAALYERKNSPYAEIIRAGFYKIWSSGIRARNVRRFTPKKYQCSARVRSTQPLSVHDVVTAYILIITGIIFSAIIFMCEVIVYKINKIRKERKKIKKIPILKEI